MAYQLNIKRGDLAPDVELTVTDENGAVVDLTGAAVTFSMVSARSPGTLIIDDRPAVITAPTQGKIAYQWGAGETDIEAGTYEGEFTIDPAVGDNMQAPTIGKILIYIERRVGDV
jgi:hypothetical protein